MNLVEQAFAVNARNKLWVGDITYISTKGGFLYLVVIIDVFHRKVVGWSMAKSMREKLVIDALEQAVGRENPRPGLIFHDDQGTQYTSRAFQKALDRHEMIQSVSRPGNPYDNAVAESFFKTLKNRTHQREDLHRPRGGQPGNLQVYRAVLQYEADPFVTGIYEPHSVRV